MRRLFALALLTVSVVWASSSHALVITIQWNGTVTGHSDSLIGAVAVSDSISGTFSYSTSAPVDFVGTIGGTTIYKIYDTLHDSSFSVSGLSGVFSNQRVAVFDWNFDQIDTRDGPAQVYSGDLFNGQTPTQLFVRFQPLTPALFSDTNLPTALDPVDFGSTSGSRIDFADAGIAFDTRMVSVTVVPAPTPLALILIGVFALHRRRQDERSVLPS